MSIAPEGRNLIGVGHMCVCERLVQGSYPAMQRPVATPVDCKCNFPSTALTNVIFLLNKKVCRCPLDPCHFRWPWVKVTVKVHTLDIAPLRSESPPQKRSGMGHVLKGFHSFTCTPTRSSAIVMSHTCLCIPSRSWYSFTDPGGMEGWVDLGAK